jgi:hypothetical protein
MRRFLWLGVCVGCGGSSNGGPSSEAANPCATPNSTYLETLTEQAGGTCGAVPSQVINVNADGTIALPTSITCASATQTGCTARDSGCTFSNQGISFSETFETTFASDGSSAMGILTLSGMGNGESCSSTYDVSIVRQ